MNDKIKEDILFAFAAFLAERLNVKGDYSISEISQDLLIFDDDGRQLEVPRTMYNLFIDTHLWFTKYKTHGVIKHTGIDTDESKSEAVEPVGAVQMIDGVVTRVTTPNEAYELVRVINKLREQNVQLHKAAESLWDGVTGVLTQKDIDRVEQLYKTELTLLLDEH